MPELLQAYWPYILIAFVIGLIVAWLAFAATRKTSIKREEGAPRDVLDEGAQRAQRNQALIDGGSVQASEASSVSMAETKDAPAKENVSSNGMAQEGGDDLTRIKGLGPKLAVMLRENGISRFDQIAGWTDADIDKIDAKLGRFQGRIRRDSWVEQAKFLASGDDSGFADRFGQNN